MANYNYSNPYVSGGAAFSPYNNGVSINPSPYIQQPPQHQNSGSIMTIFVNTEEEMANYPVAAGTTVLLLSFNLKKFWLKSTSTNGVPETPREFPFEETIKAQPTAQSIVTRDEFDALNRKLDKLLKDLGGDVNA